MAEQRTIKYGDREMPLEPGMTLENAKELMARHFPELADPKVETKKEGEKTVYVFSKKAGHKGNGNPRRLRRGSRRTKAPAYAAMLRRLCAVTAIPVVDARLVNHVERGEGERLLASDLAGHLAGETERVVEIRQQLADLPNAAKPMGSVL